MKKYWFRTSYPTWHGLGLWYPISWQGYLLSILFLFTLVVNILWSLGNNTSLGQLLLQMVPRIIVLCAIMLVVAAQYGQKNKN